MRPLACYVLLAVAALPAAAVAEPVTVNGLVAYREGLPLPPGAVTSVRLIETGAGGDRAVIAKATVDGHRNPPIPFALDDDDADVRKGATYALEAVIRLGERVLFKSPAPQRLKTPGASQQVSLVVRFVRDRS